MRVEESPTPAALEGVLRTWVKGAVGRSEDAEGASSGLEDPVQARSETAIREQEAACH